jgi:hypothetical protein
VSKASGPDHDPYCIKYHYQIHYYIDILCYVHYEQPKESHQDLRRSLPLSALLPPRLCHCIPLRLLAVIVLVVRPSSSPSRSCLPHPPPNHLSSSLPLYCRGFLILLLTSSSSLLCCVILSLACASYPCLFCAFSFSSSHTRPRELSASLSCCEGKHIGVFSILLAYRSITHLEYQTYTLLSHCPPIARVLLAMAVALVKVLKSKLIRFNEPIKGKTSPSSRKAT